MRGSTERQWLAHPFDDRLTRRTSHMRCLCDCAHCASAVGRFRADKHLYRSIRQIKRAVVRCTLCEIADHEGVIFLKTMCRTLRNIRLVYVELNSLDSISKYKKHGRGRALRITSTSIKPRCSDLTTIFGCSQSVLPDHAKSGRDFRRWGASYITRI